MVDITETFVTECLLKVQTSFESKCPAGKWYMDGWMKLQKRERKYYLLMKCSVSTQKTLATDLHAIYVRYHLDCWLGGTKKRPAGPVQL